MKWILIVLIFSTTVTAQVKPVNDIFSFMYLFTHKPEGVIKKLSSEEWSVDSNYYNSAINKTVVYFRKAWYEIKLIHDEANQSMSLRTPPNAQFYDRVIYDLKSQRLHVRQSNVVDNMFSELWENDDILHPLWILITRYYVEGEIVKYKYDIVMYK